MTRSSADLAVNYTFPYAEYRRAVEEESDARNAGVEALVIHSEKDVETGGLLLEISPPGMPDEFLIC